MVDGHHRTKCNFTGGFLSNFLKSKRRACQSFSLNRPSDWYHQLDQLTGLHSFLLHLYSQIVTVDRSEFALSFPPKPWLSIHNRFELQYRVAFTGFYLRSQVVLWLSLLFIKLKTLPIRVKLVLSSCLRLPMVDFDNLLHCRWQLKMKE